MRASPWRGTFVPLACRYALTTVLGYPMISIVGAFRRPVAALISPRMAETYERRTHPTVPLHGWAAANTAMRVRPQRSLVAGFTPGDRWIGTRAHTGSRAARGTLCSDVATVYRWQVPVCPALNRHRMTEWQEAAGQLVPRGSAPRLTYAWIRGRCEAVTWTRSADRRPRLETGRWWHDLSGPRLPHAVGGRTRRVGWPSWTSRQSSSRPPAVGDRCASRAPWTKRPSPGARCSSLAAACASGSARPLCGQRAQPWAR